MRHPGFGLQPDVDVPDAVLHYLAAQLFVDVDAFADYGQRAQTRNDHRSEEHTSELQSLMRISYAVFCLKKKKIINNTKPDTRAVNNYHNNTSCPYNTEL